jgi:hypothetical protein
MVQIDNCFVTGRRDYYSQQEPYSSYLVLTSNELGSRTRACSLFTVVDSIWFLRVPEFILFIHYLLTMLNEQDCMLLE